MKNITLTADEALIERARAVARAEHTTLNVAFREWLAGYAKKDDREERVREYRELMQQLRNRQSDGPYTREEMNER